MILTPHKDTGLRLHRARTENILSSSVKAVGWRRGGVAFHFLRYGGGCCLVPCAKELSDLERFSLPLPWLGGRSTTSMFGTRGKQNNSNHVGVHSKGDNTLA